MSIIIPIFSRKSVLEEVSCFSNGKIHIPEYRAQTALSAIKDMLTYNVHFLHAEL